MEVFTTINQKVKAFKKLKLICHFRDKFLNALVNNIPHCYRKTLYFVFNTYS